MQNWKKSGLAALLLIVVLTGCLVASEPEEEVHLSLPRETEPKEERPAHQPIEGSERANLASLADPFTLAHETREEKAQAAARKPAAEKADKPAVRAAPPPPVAAVPVARPPVPAEPKLKGIISGAAGQLALVDYGERSLTLAVGEGTEGIRVEAIEQKRALISTPQGERWLELP